MSEVWDLEISDSRRKLILMCLADGANRESRECWPSVSYIASRCSCTERTVHRHLQELEREGFIEIHRRYDRSGRQRSNMYTIALPRNFVTPPCHVRQGEGDTCVRGEGDTGVIHNRNIEPSIETKRICAPNGSRFDEWYAQYPKKKGKAVALRSWKRRKLDQHADIIIADTLKRKAREWKDPQFIPMASTYINQERWLDEITEDNNGNQKTQRNHRGRETVIQRSQRKEREALQSVGIKI